MSRSLILITAVFTLCWSSAAVAQKKLTREQHVRKDRDAFSQNDDWFYDDLGAAIDEANRTKRPLVLVFR